MLPVIVFPWYTPPSHPAPLCCAPGKQPLPALRRCWVVGRQVRPETRSRGTESSQGSPSLRLPLPCGGRHQAARAGDVLLKRQDLSSGGKARVTGCALQFPPFCQIVGGSILCNCRAPSAWSSCHVEGRGAKLQPLRKRLGLIVSIFSL